MKKILLIIGLMAFAGGAFADDLPIRVVDNQSAVRGSAAADSIVISVTALEEIRAEFAALRQAVDEMTIELQKERVERAAMVYDLLVAVVKNDLGELRRRLWEEMKQRSAVSGQQSGKE